MKTEAIINTKIKVSKAPIPSKPTNPAITPALIAAKD